LCEESEISDHMSTIISTKEAMHFVVPRWLISLLYSNTLFRKHLFICV
jgi:hypothetical protein